MKSKETYKQTGNSFDPIKEVRVAFVGLGYRADFAIRRYAYISGVQIRAVCDIDQDRVELITQKLYDKGISGFDRYSGSDDCWKTMVERDDVDLVYISTPWEQHTQMARYAMEHGKHVAIEVPAATKIDECWQLVEASETHNRHCVMLENCCYDEFVMATHNMVQDNVFGEIYHAEGAYIHRLLERVIGANTHFQDFWLAQYYMEHTGNIYPTHGLGPIAQALNISRGDRFDYLTSISTSQRGLTEYVKNTFGENSPQAPVEFALGDMNITTIRTVRGKTIQLQHDICTPRPYTRAHLLCGTKGMCHKWPFKGIALAPDHNEYLTESELNTLLVKYRPEFLDIIDRSFNNVTDTDLVARGAMDYIMDYRLVQCLREGRQPDIDVYDAAAWSSIIELSERSVLDRGASMDIPDFTCGAWEYRKPLKME